MKDLYKQLYLGVIISDYETKQTISINEYARKMLHYYDDANNDVNQILNLNKSLQNKYNQLKLSTNTYSFLDLSDHFYKKRIYLKSFLIPPSSQYNGTVRIDLLEEQQSYSNVSYQYLIDFEYNYHQLINKLNNLMNPTEKIHVLLESIIKFYKCEHSFVGSVDTELNLFSIIYENETSQKTSPSMSRVNLKKYPQWLEFYNHDTFKLKDISDLDDDLKAEREWLKKYNVKNFIIIPFPGSGAIRYVLGIANITQYYGMVSYLQTLASIIKNEMDEERFLRNMQDLNLKNNIKEKDIRLNVLGTFKITTSKGIMSYEDIQSNQTCLLLYYLINNRHRLVTISEIADTLWPNQILDHPYSSVKGAVYRARKILEKICDEPIIQATSGTYKINPYYHVSIDADEFLEECELASDRNSTDHERMYHYDKAIQLYQGSALPNFESEHWLMGKIAYITITYSDTVKDYLHLLDSHGLYKDMFKVAINVLAIESNDEDIHFMLIESLLKQGRYQMAKSHYTKAEKILTSQQKREFLKKWDKLAK